MSPPCCAAWASSSWTFGSLGAAAASRSYVSSAFLYDVWAAVYALVTASFDSVETAESIGSGPSVTPSPRSSGVLKVEPKVR